MPSANSLLKSASSANCVVRNPIVKPLIKHSNKRANQRKRKQTRCIIEEIGGRYFLQTRSLKLTGLVVAIIFSTEGDKANPKPGY